MRPVLLSYERASRDGDTRQRLRSLTELMFLPQMALLRVKRAGERRAHKALELRLLAVVAQARARELESSAVQGEWWLGPDRTEGDAPNPVFLDEDAARVRRAVATVKSGYLGRAVSGLCSAGVADASHPEVIARLTALHPAASDAVPPLPHSVPLIAVDSAALAVLVRKRLCNGSAPGPSGWCGELIAPIMRDVACARALGVLIADIANGSLSGDTEREFLLASRLIAVRKGVSGVRPIAIGEAFTKLAGLYVLAQVREALPPMFSPIQLGIGAPGGSERAVHAIRAAIESTGPDSIAVFTDARNAFNSCHRSSVLSAVYDQPSLSPTWRMFDWSYNSPSPLLVMSGERVASVLQSSEGMRQGDPLAPLGYSANVHPLYTESVAGLPDVESVAILDDWSVIGAASSVFTAVRRYEPAAAAAGIVLERSKTIVLWPHAHDPPDDVVAECNNLGLPLVRGSAKVLGTMVGCDDTKAAEWANDVVRAHARLFADLSRHDMPCQIAALVLRLCALPRVNFLSRTMPPATTAAALAEFDTMVSATARSKFGIPATATNEVSTLTHLPIRLAGLGLRSQAATAPLAYLASLAQAAPDICRIISTHTVTPLSTTTAALTDSYDRVTDTGYFDRPRPSDDPQLPRNTDDFFPLFRDNSARGLQHALTADVELATYSALYAAASPETRARLNSCSAPGAGAWLTAMPTDRVFLMLDVSVRYAFRLRLGLPPSDAMPTNCVCGTRLLGNTQHFLSCQQLKRSAMTTRHDHIVRCFASLARDSGAAVIVEPNFGGERPDAEMIWSDKTQFVDVSVTHPGASYTATAQSPLGAASLRERVKKAKYDEWAQQHYGVFVPLVFESYGAMGDLARAFVGQLNTERLSQPEGQDLPDQTASMLQQLAVALQNGNARVQDEGLLRARTAAAGGRAPRTLRHPNHVIRFPARRAAPPGLRRAS